MNNLKKIALTWNSKQQINAVQKIAEYGKIQMPPLWGTASSEDMVDTVIGIAIIAGLAPYKVSDEGEGCSGQTGCGVCVNGVWVPCA